MTDDADLGSAMNLKKQFVSGFLGDLLTSADPTDDSGDSFCDRLSCRHTVIILLTLTALHATDQYVGVRMRCWFPAHFTKSQRAYAHKVGRRSANNCDETTRRCLRRNDRLRRIIYHVNTNNNSFIYFIYYNNL